MLNVNGEGGFFMEELRNSTERLETFADLQGLVSDILGKRKDACLDYRREV